MMLQILVTTDFSSTAFNAFKYAAQLFSQYEGNITVLHSYAKITSSRSGSGVSEQNKQHEKFEIEKTRMEEFVQLAKLPVKVDYIFQEGELLQNIQELISTKAINCLVMGTTGNSGFENKILGSKTVTTINNVTIPVLSIPIYAKYEGIDTLGMTSIYDAKDKNILKKIVPFAKQYHFEVLSIHILNKKNQIAQEQIEDFKKDFATEPVSFIEKDSDDVNEGIFEFIDEHGIDMIFAVKRNRGFLQRILEKSLTEKLSYHQSIPVLIINEDFL